MFKSIKSQLQRFTACTNGNVSIMLGLSAIPVFVASGAAIDFGRYTNTHYDVAMALDAGMLAAAATIYNDEDVTTQESDAAIVIGKKYFKEALGTQNGATINDPVMTYDPEKQVIKASVTGEVYTSFMKVAGLVDMGISVSAETSVGYEELIGSDVEVSMMLDTTGSMKDGKIDSLKAAAALLVDEVIWPDQTKNTSKIALVPFADAVRLAPNGQADAKFTAITNLPTVWSGWIQAKEMVEETYTEIESQPYTYTFPDVCKIWTKNKKGKNVQPCLQWGPPSPPTEIRYEDVEVTKTRQVEAIVDKYKENYLLARPCVTERYFNSTGNFGLTDDPPGAGNWFAGDDGTRRLASMDSSDTPIANDGKTKETSVKLDDNGKYPTLAGNYVDTGNCSSIGNNNSIMPLTSDKDALKGRIQGLTIGGATAGALGTAFAWNVISPNWSNVWDSGSAPQPYSKLTELNSANKPKLFKIAVIMTDGQYNHARSNSANVGTVNTAALALCSGMKAKGIEVYTVGFMTDSTANTLLTSCADDASHFYSASDDAALKKAFKEIGKKVRTSAGHDIRLTQ